jgi:hypothetical protein
MNIKESEKAIAATTVDADRWFKENLKEFYSRVTASSTSKIPEYHFIEKLTEIWLRVCILPILKNPINALQKCHNIWSGGNIKSVELSQHIYQQVLLSFLHKEFSRITQPVTTTAVTNKRSKTN